MQHTIKNNYTIIHIFQKLLIILNRICSKMDCILKLQLIIRITVILVFQIHAKFRIFRTIRKIFFFGNHILVKKTKIKETASMHNRKVDFDCKSLALSTNNTSICNTIATHASCVLLAIMVLEPKSCFHTNHLVR